MLVVDWVDWRCVGELGRKRDEAEVVVVTTGRDQRELHVKIRVLYRILNIFRHGRKTVEKR